MEGVIAHELSHVKNYDIRLMAIVSVLVGTVVYLADWFMRSMWFGGNNRENRSGLLMAFGIIAAILAPVIASLIQMAVSRRREFLVPRPMPKSGRKAPLWRNPRTRPLALSY